VVLRLFSPLNKTALKAFSLGSTVSIGFGSLDISKKKKINISLKNIQFNFKSKFDNIVFSAMTQYK